LSVFESHSYAFLRRFRRFDFTLPPPFRRFAACAEHPAAFSAAAMPMADICFSAAAAVFFDCAIYAIISSPPSFFAVYHLQTLISFDAAAFVDNIHRLLTLLNSRHGHFRLHFRH
jgi:hypothetical protein